MNQAEHNTTEDNSLQLSPITINEDYRKKWRIHENDFVGLSKNGELISSFLYRVGGIGDSDIKNKDYFMLIKYVEAFYSDDITKDKKQKPHLEGRWCIIDKNGIEKVEFPSHKHGYIIKNSCLYSCDSNYYNIETGEFYGRAYASMESAEYVFLDNRFNDDKQKKGVMKINKKDGTWFVFH